MTSSRIERDLQSAACGSIGGRWQVAIVGFLLLLYIFMAVSATTEESNTFDEALHLTTGYLYWTHPEVPLESDNGIFAQAWASLPLLADHLHFSPLPPDPSKNLAGWEQGYDFFYLMGNDPAKMLLQGRFMISLLGSALGLLVFFWSKQLFGVVGGLISLLLFVFCPTMLAHGALVTTDMAATLGFFSATYSFWTLTHVVSARNLLFGLLGLWCLLLSKMSSPLILPIFLLILTVRIFSSRPVEIKLLSKRQFEKPWEKVWISALLLIVLMFAGIGILWLAYDFKFVGHGSQAVRLHDLYSPGFSLWSAKGMRESILENLAETNILPACYMEGLSSQMNYSILGFLCGTFYPHGTVWFFPVAFLIKTPIGTLCLFLAALVALVYWRSLSAERPVFYAGNVTPCPSVYELSPLLILGGVYALVCLSSSLNIGHRHMMPIYPALFVLAGANIIWLHCSRLFVRMGPVLLLFFAIVESLAVRPHYLAFFNQFVGGPRNGYRYLISSSLDWGQDLPGLKKWLEENISAGDTKVYLAYSGTGSPDYYGIRSTRLPDCFSSHSVQAVSFQAGVYCISATNLHGVPKTPLYEKERRDVTAEVMRWNATANKPEMRQALIKEKSLDYWNACIQELKVFQYFQLCDYFQQREPDDEVGYSILIYRVTNQEVQNALE